MQITRIDGEINGKRISAERTTGDEGRIIRITVSSGDATHETEWRPEDTYAAANYVLAMTRGVRKPRRDGSQPAITDIDGCQHPAADVCGSEIGDLDRTLELLA